MSENSETVFTKISALKLIETDLTNYCRICRCNGHGEHGLNLRPLFNDRRLTRLIANTIHIEVRTCFLIMRYRKLMSNNRLRMCQGCRVLFVKNVRKC